MKLKCNNFLKHISESSTPVAVLYQNFIAGKFCIISTRPTAFGATTVKIEKSLTDIDTRGSFILKLAFKGKVKKAQHCLKAS